MFIHESLIQSYMVCSNPNQIQLEILFYHSKPLSDYCLTLIKEQPDKGLVHVKFMLGYQGLFPFV